MAVRKVSFKYLRRHLGWLCFLHFLVAAESPASSQDTVDACARKDRPTSSWEGKLSDGTKLTRTAAETIFSRHENWVETSSDTPIELKNGTLEEYLTTLSGLVASGWEVKNGRLSAEKSKWRNTDVFQKRVLLMANLRGADFSDSCLQETIFNGANLQKTNFFHANLRRAYFLFADLEGAHLNSTILQKADFSLSILRNASLSSAQIQGAQMEGAYIQGGQLVNSNLEGANLTEAKLHGANFSGAILKNATLRSAELQNAKLSQTNLEGANFEHADLNGLLYQPLTGHLPDLWGLSNAKNLETIRFKDDPRGMEKLREAFKKSGMREQERQITYAIKRSRWEKAFDDGEIADALFNYILFDMTVRYGMEPGRALKTLAVLIILFLIPYTYALAFPDPSRGNGIWRVWPDDVIGPKTEPEFISALGFRAFGYAAYFSLLSAFHIGWRELNVGNWITRIQPRAYVMRATGTFRVISGVQSLISVYLLAIWVLTYFGRPFE